MAFKEYKVQEEVSPNLIPMIDIMFLLLLFFMLNADMAQRELEEVSPPRADQAQEDKPEENVDRITVNVHHLTDAEAACSIYEEGQKRQPDEYGEICGNDDHWMISVQGARFTLKPTLAALPGKGIEGGLKELKTKLEYLADTKRQVPGDRKSISERHLIIRADKAARYEYIQRAIEQAAAAGLYRVEVAAFIPKAEFNKR